MGDVVSLPNAYEAALAEMMGPEIPRMSKVVVDGREIPGLFAKDCGEEFEFSFSHNFSSVFLVPRNAAVIFAAGVATALAVASGYSHIGAESKNHPFAPSIIMLGEVPTT